MIRIARAGWMMIAAAALAACGGGSDTSGESPQPADTPATTVVSAADTADTTRITPPAPPPAAAARQDTGVTPWRALEMPSEPWVQSAESPQALLQRVRDVVAAQLEEPDASVLPTRMESAAADSATGILVHPDQADDSVRDVEFRLHMRREGATWTVVAVERREHCRRGVAEGGLCA
ncbi:MAG TPA: hypothetical protein VFQ76_20530 [Longimicrobiaceae bacterium]|nr:hypothetical protein [Longimicrobiaceae bacterium]